MSDTENKDNNFEIDETTHKRYSAEAEHFQETLKMYDRMTTSDPNDLPLLDLLAFQAALEGQGNQSRRSPVVMRRAIEHILKLEKALHFYAEEKNWVTYKGIDGQLIYTCGERGSTAREALKK